MSKKLKVLTLLLMSSGISGCAKNTTETVRTVSNYELIAQPITYSKGTDTDGVDTMETVKQIEQHNSRYECVVNNDCPVVDSNKTPKPN